MLLSTPYGLQHLEAHGRRRSADQDSTIPLEPCMCQKQLAGLSGYTNSEIGIQALAAEHPPCGNRLDQTGTLTEQPGRDGTYCPQGAGVSRGERSIGLLTRPPSGPRLDPSVGYSCESNPDRRHYNQSLDQHPLFGRVPAYKLIQGLHRCPVSSLGLETDVGTVVSRLPASRPLWRESLGVPRSEMADSSGGTLDIVPSPS
jgi:hypothetical protein